MQERSAMKVHKLTLNGTADDGARLDEFCERLAPTEFAAGARLRALAVELARREELEVSAVAYEDESLELEVVLAGDRFRERVTIDRDSTGGRCQMSWERWADMADDSAIEKTAQMIVAVTVSCAASR
jgi:hypothetical protein